MKRLLGLALVLASTSIVPAIGAPTATPRTANATLFQKAIHGNPALKSYTASATLAARMTHPLPLRKTLNGNAWYKRPSLKIEFNDVPKQLEKFKDLSVSGASFEGTSSQYTLSSGSDDGTTTTFILVPRNSGSRVKNLTIMVDDATAKINQGLWSYNDGSKLTVKPSYSMVSGVRVGTQFQIDASFPGYGVSGTLTLSNIKLNAPVDPSVFATTAP